MSRGLGSILPPALALLCTVEIARVASEQSVGRPSQVDVVMSSCGTGTTCLKLDLLRLMSKLGNMTRLPVAPGITLVGTDRTRQLGEKLLQSAMSQDPMEPFLKELVAEYFGSLNLTLQIRESSLLSQLRGLGYQMWTTYTGETVISRGTKHKTTLYAVGTIAAVGFAMLAALCGKALMASMLALALSALVALRAGAGGFGNSANFANPLSSSRVTQYEIISKPSYATGPAHLYEHDHHHHATVAAAAAPAYTYGKRDLDGGPKEE